MSGSKSSIVSEDVSSSTITSSDYKLYPSRWILLISVTLLNLANYSHWVAFASVAKQGAEYYQVSGPEVNHGLFIKNTGCQWQWPNILNQILDWKGISNYQINNELFSLLKHEFSKILCFRLIWFPWYHMAFVFLSVLWLCTLLRDEVWGLASCLVLG